MCLAFYDHPCDMRTRQDEGPEVFTRMSFRDPVAPHKVGTRPSREPNYTRLAHGPPTLTLSSLGAFPREYQKQAALATERPLHRTRRRPTSPFHGKINTRTSA
ncbi:hypothetical protein PMIN01_01125 [Paraphaeosphaeria minitans]|uniref:Uncharacterized protein n=1 Tax=Paraphaeosphaeria minitans TaxID=565426 RepID=A0A9P6GUD7_9PLEO|nr:hypothetical protein PMIN01_01125 [Paraphaeosphaeria minitans]